MNLPKSVSVLVVLLVASLALAQDSAAPKKDIQLSPGFKEAGTRAYDAVMRVGGVGESAESYEPRRLDAEKALTEAEDKAESDADKEQLKILQSKLWLEELSRNYSQRLHAMASGVGEFPNPKLLDLFMQSGKAVHQCSAEATAIFRPRKLNEADAALANKGACLSMAQDAEKAKDAERAKDAEKRSRR